MPGNVRAGGPAGSQKPPHATPTRAMSLDSLHDKSSNASSNLDQKIQEYIPTRTTRAIPKTNHAAMQFVKTGPATLYKSANDQIKKTEEVKELRKTLVEEETDWQALSSSNQNALEEGSDWQSNLDKWKSSRRKRLQTTVDSIIQIKKNEQEDEMARMRRKSKTFSQIQDDKTKRGRKYNLKVHDDDDNDLSTLGLSPSKSNGSIADPQEDQDAKDLLDQDNKDAKSDAGFCTGSDTGSDGVFAEDNISDTSSALVNAQVFEIASKLEETPIVGSPINKVPSIPLVAPVAQEDDSLETANQYSDADINEVDEGKPESQEPVEEHQYQTLEEVRQEVVPPPPVRAPPMEPPEVLDVTWTDGPSQAAPPSEPPPPPPPDDDSDSDASEQPQSLPVQEEDSFKRENSTRRLKKELWRRRSDFLGTSSQYIEEGQAVKPPPDLSDLLRQERESERSLIGSKSGKTTTQEMLSDLEIARREREIIENLERSEQLRQQQQQQQQIWEVQEEDAESGELDDHMQYQEVKNPLTAFELDTGPKVAKVVPVTSTNNSVTETTNLEHAQLTPDGVDWTHATLDSTINIEERHAEVLDNHVATMLPEPQFRIATQTSGVAESQLLSDHFVASRYTLDYNTNSVASSDSHPDEYKKLAELEEEMMRHDKDMLRRAGHLPDRPSPTTTSTQSSDSYNIQEGSIIPPPLDSSFKMQRRQPPSHLPIQEFYTAPTYDATPPMDEDSLTLSREDKSVGLPAGSPSEYATLASPHPFSRSNSHSSIETKRHLPLQPARSTPSSSPRDSIPEPLPRKKKVVSPQTPSKTQRILPELNTAERLEAIRVSRMTSTETLMSGGEHMEPQGSSSSLSGQQMSKQTLLALSAIPKPRLIDNESWIKKKQEGQKRDYSKHWLHQEAEQRRLEQQDRISRPKYTPPLPQRRSPQSASPQFPPPQSSPQTTSFLPTQNSSSMFTTQNPSPTYSSYPQALRSPSPSHNASPAITNNNSNNNSSNNSNTTTSSTTTSNGTGSWRNQATTYQPHIPAPAANGDKALPDSIINNLTQRINNKNTKNTYTSTSGRVGTNYVNNNYRDENYHDYMNADALSSASGHSPLFQAGQPSPPSTQQPEANSPQDQRLLSVSGKKKCSHCSEELGRGAAMIIESLRLFYHIPCFKCCVCGIQLGNGSAGADVRVRNHKLHCHNCYSNDEGMKFSKV